MTAGLRALKLGDKIALGSLVADAFALVVALVAWLWPSLAVGITPGESPSAPGPVSTIASWVAAGAFAVFVAYLSGYFYNAEMRGRERSAHAQHLVLGLIFSLAIAPISLLVLVACLKQSDYRLVLFYHSLLPMFVLSFPAFAASIVRYAQQVAIEHSPERIRQRLSDFKKDAGAHHLPQE